MFNPFFPFFLIINRTPRYWIPLLPVCFLLGYAPLSCRIFFFWRTSPSSRTFSFDSRRILSSQIANPVPFHSLIIYFMDNNLLKLYIYIFFWLLYISLYLINYQWWKINEKSTILLWAAFVISKKESRFEKKNRI